MLRWISSAMSAGTRDGSRSLSAALPPQHLPKRDIWGAPEARVRGEEPGPCSGWTLQGERGALARTSKEEKKDYGPCRADACRTAAVR